MTSDPRRLSDLQAAQFLLRHDMLPFLTIRNAVCRKSNENIDTPLLVLLAEQGAVNFDDVCARLSRDAAAPPPPRKPRRELDVPRPPPRRRARVEPEPALAADRVEAGAEPAPIAPAWWALRVAGAIAGIAAAIVAVMHALWG